MQFRKLDGGARTHFGQRKIAEQDGQQIVEFMGETTGEKAQRFKPVEPVLALLLFPL